MISKELFLKLVKTAVKAPSSHNTQPWLISLKENRIFIKPDYSRSLKIADPKNRELFISLGCLAETFIIALAFHGFNSRLFIHDSIDNFHLCIKTIEDENIIPSPLFPYINLRQTTRNNFNTEVIPNFTIDELLSLDLQENIKIKILTKKENFDLISELITEANAYQIGNKHFIDELVEWMRFNQREAMQKGDGLYSACSGIPSIGRFIGKFLIKNFIKIKSENKRLTKQLDNSGAIVLFSSKTDSFSDLVKTGMIFNKFALLATKSNLCHSFLNSPCQVEHTRKKLAANFNEKYPFPQLIIRLGYSSKMPYSFRRRINEVITDKYE